MDAGLIIDNNKVCIYEGDAAEVNIPEGITTICDHAFYKCESLQRVIFPNTLKKIGKSAFEKCKNLSFVIFPESLEIIDDFAFSECGNFGLDSQAFDTNFKARFDTNFKARSAKVKKELIIPDSVQYIGKQAFTYPSFTGITLGKGIKKIGDAAFGGDNIDSFVSKIFLTHIAYKGDIASWCEIDFETKEANPLFTGRVDFIIDGKPVEEIKIPKTITEIKKATFVGWKGTKIILPRTITKIGKDAFCGCENISEIELYD